MTETPIFRRPRTGSSQSTGGMGTVQVRITSWDMVAGASDDLGAAEHGCSVGLLQDDCKAPPRRQDKRAAELGATFPNVLYVVGPRAQTKK